MDIHNSIDYYWADGDDRRLKKKFNELDYPDFSSSKLALEKFLKDHPGIHPVETVTSDLKTLTSKFLIDNIDLAFEAWKSSINKDIAFSDFCEYVLPYRLDSEPLQNWRGKYKDTFAWITDSANSIGFHKILPYLYQEGKVNFTMNMNQPTQLLPYLSALQLLHRKQGDCLQLANRETFALRSQGIPMATDIITFWATSTNRHFVAEIFDPQMIPTKFDPGLTTANPFNAKLPREPAKVLRNTYSKQSSTLSFFTNDEDIPEGVLRRQNYIDVTQNYWETADLEANLFPVGHQPEIAYVSVLNGGEWRPTWWGKITDNKVTFSNMCKGAVFLPSYYIQGQLIPAGYPVVMGYKTNLVLKPDTISRREITIKEQAGYLIFRPGKSYTLLYWDNEWLPIEERTAEADEHFMTFKSVPGNCLLRFVPEYSAGKERPFIIDETGERFWW